MDNVERDASLGGARTETDMLSWEHGGVKV